MKITVYYAKKYPKYEKFELPNMPDDMFETISKAMHRAMNSGIVEDYRVEAAEEN